MPTFLGAICMGILLGLFFAVYLYKMKRAKSGARTSMPVVKEFSEIIKNGRKSNSLFSRSTNSGSDENNPHDANAFI